MDSELAPNRATQYAYRILAARPLSEKEFRTKLKGKGYEGSAIETLVARFKELGYLDDVSYAGQRARMLAVNKLWGNRRIEMSLKEKGISRELIQNAVNLARKEITEREAVVKLLGHKGKGQGTALKDNKGKRRLMQSLMGKGFPPGLVFDILSLSGEEEWHDGE
jgi:regulatory protein